VSTVDLICLGYNPWSRMWKRNQQIVRGLADLPWIGNVLFLNPPFWASNLVFDPDRAFALPGRSALRAVLPRRSGRKISIFTPLRFPLGGRFTAIRAAEDLILRRVIRRTTSRPYVLLVNRPDDPTDPLTHELFDNAAVRIFDWSDDFETFASTEADRLATRQACEWYISYSDVVLAVNEALGRRARVNAPSAHVLRNGTDARAFGRVVDGSVRPARLRGKHAERVVGYVGYRVRDRLDLELIDYLAASRPTWQFVFVGPTVGEEPLKEILASRSNVRVIPPVSYTDLPAVMAAFDACILPNRVNTHTSGNDPIKLYDYLAAGKPVVSTSTAGAEMFRELISVADTAEGFLHALENAMSSDSPAERRKRHSAAREHSWDARSQRVAEILSEALEQRAALRGENAEVSFAAS
jgi:glycosyltransferase involved in cell wall biosynthesis